MRPAAAITGLGLLAACTAAPVPEPPPTGPPHLVVLWQQGTGTPQDLATQGLAFPEVQPVAVGEDATREATKTGTWPGFPARYRLEEILKAVGYATTAPPPGEHAPRFQWVDAHGDTVLDRADLLAQGLWDHSLVVSTGPDPDRTLVLTGGALREPLRGTTITDPASVLDVLPTLLDAAGTAAPAGGPGRSLLDRSAAVAQVWFQVVDEGVWVARAEGQTLSWRDGDLAALAAAPLDDPRFTWAPANRPPQETLKAALVRWQVSKTQDPAGPPLDPALKEVLRQRGYW